ncbi:helix-turn-helix transcriptional regulator [Bacillus sp. AFS017336]|uniref:helix-turn-helix domain-containing protein n=1 Tax=Bacillus sp. AFS017336 TaxID=2033489 RepID=UPI000BF18E9E|nr:helix-turn-helix transcriptional regulator [Bacillus sp. AFS017336]PEL04371.1 hypothetical protein CN601_21725 [Bacillus sp. AFS017336]
MNQSLIYEFKALLDKKMWSNMDLAAKSGVHYSDISRIFNQKKILPFHYLEAITEAFELPTGRFYSYYSELCFNQNRYLDKRRSVAFIYNCALNGFTEELNCLFTQLLEEKSKTIRTKNYQLLFQVAEQLFSEGNEVESLPLYENIIEHMPNHFSEEVAISYFRKFYLIRLTDEGHSALVHVLEYISYMPEEFQELTLLWITATYYMLKQWNEVLLYAKRLEKMAKNKDHYGRALMYQGFALTRLGTLEEVLELISKYEKVNEYYTDIAIGNRFVTLIDFGELHYVDEYYKWLRDRDDFYVGIPRILETFVKLNRLEDASKLINSHKKEINKLAGSSNLHLQQLYSDYCYSHALFKCESKKYIDGLSELIEVANRVEYLGIYEKFKQCLLAIWKYRSFLTSELEQRYIRMLNVNENQK